MLLANRSIISRIEIPKVFARIKLRFIMDEKSAALPVVCRYNPRLAWIILLGFFQAVFMVIAPFMIQRDSPKDASLWPFLLLCWPLAAFIGWGMT